MSPKFVPPPVTTRFERLPLRRPSREMAARLYRPTGRSLICHCPASSAVAARKAFSPCNNNTRAPPCAVRLSGSSTRPRKVPRSTTAALNTTSTSRISPGAFNASLTIRSSPRPSCTSSENTPNGTPKKANRPSASENTPRTNSRESGSGNRFTAASATGVTPSAASTRPTTVARPRNVSTTGIAVPLRAEFTSTASLNTARSTPSAAATTPPRCSFGTSNRLPSFNRLRNRSPRNSPATVDSRISRISSALRPLVSVVEMTYGIPLRMKSKAKLPLASVVTWATRRIHGLHSKDATYSSL